MSVIDHTIFFILFTGAFLFVVAGIPLLIRIARTKKLMDISKDDRKIHSGSTPTLGGIVFISALWVSFSLHPLAIGLQGYSYLLASTIMLFIVGIKDDLYVLNPYKKLSIELIAALSIIFGGGIYVQSFGGVFGVQSLPYIAGIAVSVAVIVVVVNAVNLIDGIDGLAGSVVMTSASFFAYWFWVIGDMPAFIFAMIFVASMAGFLWHNREPASVFMGDTGSLISGFYLAVLGIHFLNTAIELPQQVFWQQGAPVVLVALLIIPLYDTLRVFVLRTINGGSPFKADSNHIHHQLIHSGFSHTQSVLILIGCQVVITAVAIALTQYLSINWLLATVVGFSLLLFPTVSFKRKVLKNIPYVQHFPEKINGSSKDKEEKKENAPELMK